MTTFWLGAVAAAVVLLAVLGVLQYARSGSNLLVSVRQYEFELPATAQQAFARLAERISPWSDEPLVGIDDDVAGAWKPSSRSLVYGLGRGSESSGRSFSGIGGRRAPGAAEWPVPGPVQTGV